jgi:hypothetical protein
MLRIAADYEKLAKASRATAAGRQAEIECEALRAVVGSVGKARSRWPLFMEANLDVSAAPIARPRAQDANRQEESGCTSSLVT